eukprot:403348218
MQPKRDIHISKNRQDRSNSKIEDDIFEIHDESVYSQQKQFARDKIQNIGFQDSAIQQKLKDILKRKNFKNNFEKFNKKLALIQGCCKDDFQNFEKESLNASQLPQSLNKCRKLAPIDYENSRNHQEQLLNSSGFKSFTSKNSSPNTHLQSQNYLRPAHLLGTKNNVDPININTIQNNMNQDQDQNNFQGDGNLDFFDQQRDRSFSTFTQIQQNSHCMYKDRTLSDNAIAQMMERSTNLSSHQSQNNREEGGFQIKLIPIGYENNQDNEMDKLCDDLNQLQLQKSKSNDSDDISPQSLNNINLDANENIYHLPLISNKQDSQNLSVSKQVKETQSYYQYHIQKLKNRGIQSQTRDSIYSQNVDKSKLLRNQNENISGSRKMSIGVQDRKQSDKLNKMMFQLEISKERATQERHKFVNSNNSLTPGRTNPDVSVQFRRNGRSLSKLNYVNSSEQIKQSHKQSIQEAPYQTINQSGIKNGRNLKIKKRSSANCLNELEGEKNLMNQNIYYTNNNTYGSAKKSENLNNSYNTQSHNVLNQTQGNITFDIKEKAQFLKLRLQRQQIQ